MNLHLNVSMCGALATASGARIVLSGRFSCAVAPSMLLGTVMAAGGTSR